jgi:dTMP kinase
MKLVSLEGPDFSGKTTLANALVAKLRRKGLRVEKTETPSKMVTGIFTGLLRNSKDKIDPRVYALVYAADHLHHYLSTKDTYDADAIVLERSVLSYFVYQGLVLGVDTEWLKELNKFNGTVPDLTVIVKVPVEELIRRSRVRKGLKDVFEKEEFLKKVAKAFYNLPDWLVKKYNVVYMDYDPDTAKLAEKVAAMI